MTERTFRLKAVDPLESERQAGVIRYLKTERKVCFFIRINGGGRLVGRIFIWFYRLFLGGREYKGKGVVDIVGMIRGGRFFCLEVKRPGEEPSAEQDAFLSIVKEFGGIAGVVNNWQQAKAILSDEDSG